MPAAERSLRALYHRATSRVGSIVGTLIWRWRQRPVGSGLPPGECRPDARRERQRLETLEVISGRVAEIRAAADRHRIPAEAIAGAIVWEGLENPYLRPWGRLGPGKVRPIRFLQPAYAELVEREQSVRQPIGTLRRVIRLRDPGSAIEYVAAILGHHAAVYEDLAGVEIRNDVGVLCTLYQGGDSERRAKRFADGRASDPSARPRPGNDMGPWVARNLDFLSSLLRAEDGDRTATFNSGSAASTPRRVTGRTRAG
jgi:hypothetical protein